MTWYKKRGGGKRKRKGGRGKKIIATHTSTSPKTYIS
jgi:hypothetical protein